MTIPGVPTRFLATCEFCHNELDTRQDGHYQHVCGWTKNRSGGGAHAIALAERHTRWMHGYCVDRLIRGNQQSLFDKGVLHD